MGRRSDEDKDEDDDDEDYENDNVVLRIVHMRVVRKAAMKILTRTMTMARVLQSKTVTQMLILMCSSSSLESCRAGTLE